MRDSDREEIWASHNLEPGIAVESSIEQSTLSWAIRKGEYAIGVFGVGAEQVDSERGSPWLLATDELTSITIRFLRQSRGCVRDMLAQHSFLENWVDERNVTSIKWLKWCGFTLFDAEPHGVEQRPFCRFEMRR